MHLTRNIMLATLVVALSVSGFGFNVKKKYNQLMYGEAASDTATQQATQHYSPYQIYKEYVFPTFEIDTTNVHVIADFSKMIHEDNSIRRKCLIAMHADKKITRQRQFLERNIDKTEQHLWEVDLASDLMSLIVYDTDHTGENYKEIIQQLIRHGFFRRKPQFQQSLNDEEVNIALAELGLKTQNGPPVQKELDRLAKMYEDQRAERQQKEMARRKRFEDKQAQMHQESLDLQDEM